MPISLSQTFHLVTSRLERGSSHCLHAGCNSDAQRASKLLARHLLSLKPRARIVLSCPRTGLLLVNSSGGDRCVRFHETAALRRVCRTRLDLPRTLRGDSNDGGGLFDAAAYDERATELTKAAGAVGTESKSQRAGTTDCSLLDFVYLPEASVLLGLIGGRPQV